MSADPSAKPVKDSGSASSKQSSEIATTHVDINDPTPPASSVGSAKLLPAPAPKVSAWGSSSISTPDKPAAPSIVASDADPKATQNGIQNGIQKEQWPSAEEALVKEAIPAGTSKSMAAPKVAASLPPKVKNTGKEKWVPYEATIVISSNSGKGNTKKKNNSPNNNGNSKKKNNNKSKTKDQKKKTDPTASTDAPAANGKSQASQNKKIKDVTETIQVLSLNSGSTIAGPKVPDAQQATSPAKTEVGEGTVEVAQDSSQGENLESKESDNQSGKAQDTKQNTFNKKHQRRNSEQYNKFNPSANNTHRSHRYNKNYQSYRNTGYQNVPFFVNNFNYGYNSVYSPAIPNQPYPYPGSFIPLPKSNSGSPATTSPALSNSNLSGTPAFIRNPSLNYPYVEDPLTLVINQLNYYFSIENLLKDTYLRKQMNSSGFVSLSKLIQFNRLKTLTGNDINVLYNALNFTPHLEVADGKVRVREGWANWVLPVAQRDDSAKDDEAKPVEAR